jgi:hypothetical protein
VVGGHGVAVCCARVDGALCARAMARSSTPLLAVPWMRAFEWRWRCMECSLALCVRQIGAVAMGDYSVREKQGLVPDGPPAR